jgi:hypothetical protein
MYTFISQNVYKYTLCFSVFAKLFLLIALRWCQVDRTVTKNEWHLINIFKVQKQGHMWQVKGILSHEGHHESMFCQ